MKKATIYTTSEFMGNVFKIECTLKDFGFRKYAQYEKAAFVRYVPKGKRNEQGIIKGYHPYILILEGHGHPEPESMFVDLGKSSTGLSVSQSKYRSFDENYKTDFDKAIDPVLAEKTVLFDVRHTKQFVS
jgi:hypothetical protein